MRASGWISDRSPVKSQVSAGSPQKQERLGRNDQAFLCILKQGSGFAGESREKAPRGSLTRSPYEKKPSLSFASKYSPSSFSV